jgi:hypothetical protein
MSSPSCARVRLQPVSRDRANCALSWSRSPEGAARLGRRSNDGAPLG